MLTDYKISRVTRQDDGTMTVVVRFYEGAITTELELGLGSDPMIPVTRYRRTRMIGERTYQRATMSDVELRRYLNWVLGQSRTRTPIAEQRDV